MNANLKARLKTTLLVLKCSWCPGAATVRDLMDEHDGLEQSLESTQHTVEALHEHLSAERDNAFLDASALAEMKTRAEKAESENTASRETADGLRGALAAEEITNRRTIAGLERAETENAALKARIEKTHACPACPERSDLERIRKWVEKWRDGPPFVEGFADLDWILDEAEHSECAECAELRSIIERVRKMVDTYADIPEEHCAPEEYSLRQIALVLRASTPATCTRMEVVVDKEEETQTTNLDEVRLTRTREHVRDSLRRNGLVEPRDEEISDD